MIRSFTPALAAIVSLGALLALGACDDRAASTSPPKTSTGGTHSHDHAGHDHAHDDHDHDHAHDHGGPVIELGSATIGPFSVTATRDQGPITPGKDAPIDVTVKAAADAALQPAAVRFWIGTPDAKGSVKAKAEIENPKEPDRWHTHAEIPAPLPDGSKLWIEIEDATGTKHTGSFDLKM